MGRIIRMKTTLRSLAFLFTASVLFVVPCGAALAAEDQEAPVVSATDTSRLADHVGKEVVVEGVVKRAGKGPNDGIRFLNFDGATRTGFVAAIFSGAFAGMDPIEDYVGKTVRVRGDLEAFNEQVQIRVNDAAQIEVVSGAEAAVPGE